MPPRRTLAAIALLGLAAAAPVLPGVGGSDGRVTIDASMMPWRALARLQVPGESRCTAVVLGPRTVLTAAHCLWGRRLDHFMPAASVHVLTGYAAGNFAHHSISTGYRLASGDRTRPAAPADDFAVVTLADPIGTDALPLADADPPVGTPVLLGGYNQDRAEVIQADTQCRIIGTLPGRLVHDCAGTHGTSGAPLLARTADGRYQVVGLQVAAFTTHAGGIAVAASRLRAALPDPPE